LKKGDQYFRWVAWSDEDQIYIGYCPDLTHGGCCHGKNPVKVYAELCEIIDELVACYEQDNEALPEVKTQPPADLVTA
jgi:predicted RNase H-like HicB family nuclease